MITHASIIRPIIDYLLIATQGNVTITICDVPLQEAVWEELINKSGLNKLVDFYTSKNIKINLLDLRLEVSTQNNTGVISRRVQKERDPKGYSVVDLKEKSYLLTEQKDSSKLEITNYGTGTVSKHHNQNRNEYLIAKTILNADLFINVPKLKTHRKAGVTLSLKNLMANGDKSWIAHHRRGVVREKILLPEYIRWYTAYYLKVYAPVWLTSLFYFCFRLFFLKGRNLREHGMLRLSAMEGNWHGNDTVWRTILDLNNIIFFADKSGRLQPTPQRKYLSIIDGIIAMDKEGPMDGVPKPCGTIAGGFHPACVDYLASYIMGFDHSKIPQIAKSFTNNFFETAAIKPEDISVSSNIDWKKLNLDFEAAKGWKGKIERKS